MADDNDKLGFSDLFDFGDESPLHKAQQGISRLEKAYEAFVKQSQKQNEALRAALKGVVAAMDTTAKALDTVSTNTRKGREEASRLSAQVVAQTKQYADLKARMAEQVAQTKLLSKEHRDLQKSYALLAKAQQRAGADQQKTAEAQMRSRIKLDEEAQKAHIRLEEAKQKHKLKLEELTTKQAVRESERRIKQAEKEARATAAAAEKAHAERQVRGGAGSINDLKARRDAAEATYRRMGTGTPELVKEGQLQKVRQLNQALNESQAAMLLARKGAAAATGSYNALVQQNVELARAIRSLPGAINPATGAINKHNKEAVRMMETYRRNTEALKVFDARMGLSFRNVGNYTGALKGAGRAVEQYFLGLMGEFASAYALAAATQKMFASNLALSDAQAGVMKTVGMTKREVDELAESFKELETRTTLEGLFDIARIGGQFGVSAREIESFTEAANMAAVALGDEFKGGVEEVATELYMLRGLFADTRTMDPGTALEKIGSAINSLGASGAATGPVVAEFTKRLGQLGKLGPSIDQALGLGAALQELGLSAEIASGGYSNVIIQLGQTKNAERAAKFMNMTTKAFRDMLRENPNQLLLEMAQRLASLKNGTEVMRSFGVMSQESIKVMNTLGTNIDRVRELQQLANEEFRKGTSISEEYAVVNDTLAGSWEKLKNAMVNSMTSGAVGNFLKRQLDIFRNAFKEISTWAPNTREAARSQAEFAAEIARGDQKVREAVEGFEDLMRQQRLYGKMGGEAAVRFREHAAVIQAELGKEAVKLNEATGLWEQNAEAIERAWKARKKISDGSGIELLNRLETATSERDQVLARKREAQERIRELEKGFSDTIIDRAKDTKWGASTALLNYPGFSDKDKARLQEIRKLHFEILSLNKQELEVSEDIAAARDAAYEASLNFRDLRRARIIAAGGPQKHEMTDAERERLLALAGGGEGDGEDLKNKRDEAEEARHALWLLQKQIAVTRAEWAVAFGEKAMDDFGLSEHLKGASEQLGFLAAELDRLEDLNAGQLAKLERRAEAEREVARETAAEKLRHNKAGKDGERLIAAQLAEELLAIDMKLFNDREKLANKRVETERRVARELAAINRGSAEERVAAVKAIGERAGKRGLFTKQNDLDVEEAKQWFDDIKEIQSALFSFGAEVGDAYFNIRRMRLDTEMAYLQETYQKELAAAGDNEQLKYELSETYRKKELKLRQEQARAQKQQAIFSIIVSTAQAVAQALGQMGPVLGPIMAGIIGGMGLAQLATVMSQPIPQFFRGVKSSPEGPARVAETGPELAIAPDGRLTYYERPQVAMLEQGTEVKTHGETQGILRRLERVYGDNGTKTLVGSLKASERAINTPKQEVPSYDELKHAINAGNRRVVDAIKGRRETHHNADGTRTTRDNEKWVTYMNQKYGKR